MAELLLLQTLTPVSNESSLLKDSWNQRANTMLETQTETTVLPDRDPAEWEKKSLADHSSIADFLDAFETGNLDGFFDFDFLENENHGLLEQNAELTAHNARLQAQVAQVHALSARNALQDRSIAVLNLVCLPPLRIYAFSPIRASELKPLSNFRLENVLMYFADVDGRHR